MKEIMELIAKEFDEHVPASGPAKTVYGEIVRALNRVAYRFYNDGDKIAVGYGNETCNSAARYIASNTTPEIEAFMAEKLWDIYSDDEYERKLIIWCCMVYEFITEHKYELMRENTEDCITDYSDPTDYRYDDDEDDWDEDEDDEEYDW